MQEKLFLLIKSRYQNKEQLIADLMELLNVGRSAVYKRMSGTVLLNVKELETLIQHYQIDTSLLFEQSQNQVHFNFP
ncbi:MAG: helix-turn-helix domain-containing protein, partial [Bacteroidota bacterium]